MSVIYIYSGPSFEEFLEKLAFGDITENEVLKYGENLDLGNLEDDNIGYRVFELLVQKQKNGYRLDLSANDCMSYTPEYLADNDILTPYLGVKDLAKISPLLVDDNGCSIVHGFYPGRSPVTNAKAHIGYEATLFFDIKDCFDSTIYKSFEFAKRKYESFYRFFKNHSWALLDEGVARQGLPTSPALANIALSEVDSVIAGVI